MNLIDSHCHLDFPEFDADRQSLFEECKRQGIQRFIVPGVTADTWDRLDLLNANYPECFIAHGLHPCFIEHHKVEHLETLKQRLALGKSVAVGEIGLDFYVKELDRNKQIETFAAQLKLAQAFKLPVILHVRKAHDEVIKRLKEINTTGGIVHAFNGSLQQAHSYMALGFKFGFGGALTWPNANHLRSLAQTLPLESLVLETDSPDMPAYNHKQKRNTPLSVLSVVETLESLRKESIKIIAKQTTKNVAELFSLV